MMEVNPKRASAKLSCSGSKHAVTFFFGEFEEFAGFQSGLKRKSAAIAGK